MNKLSLSLVAAIGLIALEACGEPAAPTAAENERIDEAMARVKVEQDRSDLAEIRKQADAAELHRERMNPSAPVMTTPARTNSPNIPRQHFPSARATAESQGIGN